MNVQEKKKEIYDIVSLLSKEAINSKTIIKLYWHEENSQLQTNKTDYLISNGLRMDSWTNPEPPATGLHFDNQLYNHNVFEKMQ